MADCLEPDAAAQRIRESELAAGSDDGNPQSVMRAV
jgi:hypothetical protein